MTKIQKVRCFVDLSSSLCLADDSSLQDRKYFDSGDYALSKAGIAPEEAVGTAIPNPQKYATVPLHVLLHRILANIRCAIAICLS